MRAWFHLPYRDGACCSFVSSAGAWTYGADRRVECTFDDWSILGAPCPFEIRNECGWWWPGEFNEFRCLEAL